MDSRINLDILRAVEIVSKQKDSKITYTLRFRDKACSRAEPGQFIMLWVPSENECPMSLSEISRRYAAVTVRAVGRGTKKLCSMKAGEKIWIRGPYGRGFTIQGNTNLLVGGGTGIAPLISLAEKSALSGRDVTLLLAGDSSDSIPLLTRAKNLKKVGVKVVYATEDGTLGFKGVATDLLNHLLKERRFDQIYTCGPELMIKKVYDIASAYNIPIQASLERYIKCGINLCGSCVIGRYLVCRDGPVFDTTMLKEVKEELGRFKRAPSGLLKKIV
ncbi:MAG: dihydroorotate dehydrogenase electron transfer subunit [Nitrososphaerales archaeon]